MKKTIQQPVVVTICDICGNDVSVKTHAFRVKEFDGHRNEIDFREMDLCVRCEEGIWECLEQRSMEFSKQGKGEK